MKHLLTLSGFTLSLVLSSCNDYRGRIEGGSFDPLLSPGAQLVKPEGTSANYSFKVGQYVTAASNATAFFNKKPQGNADADELLNAGTTMRVIKPDGSFIKVELDSGKVGYVAAALLVESGLTTLPSPPALPATTEIEPTDATTIPPIVAPTTALPSATPETIPPIEVPLPEPAASKQQSNP